ncbi:MAG: response regulator [Nitrospira sp.]|nr:response regulator [Nitrospira sp.]
MGKGTGLDSTVYGIVQTEWRHFQWHFKRTEPRTTFTIYLPRIAEDCDALPPRRSRRANDPETILLVEDNDMVRGLAHTILVAQHYHVVAARSGEEALRLVRDQGRHIALLVTDMVMPKTWRRRAIGQRTQACSRISRSFRRQAIRNRMVCSATFDARMAFLPKPYTRNL